jgi:hypothetical protein
MTSSRIALRLVNHRRRCRLRACGVFREIASLMAAMLYFRVDVH